ncbi:DUF4129 domain-containing transglutaminase family protein [Brevibacillus dissolubilis]|uniref:DUF4129 domain-containing transglutaminase family protein n=1 Tax=Brevibacillus dissolubilis TaxID=1844116 RepID=UPI00210044D3|nr:transglutaminase domain-containing protein [Brevibacillus dissolubilis]
MVMSGIFKRTRGLDWLATLFLFLLLREWLVPLPGITDTGDLSAFYYMVAMVLVTDLLFQWRLLGWLVKLAGALWLLHGDFFVTSFFSMEWLTEVYVRLMHDAPLIMQQQWWDMSPVTRNVLFYLLLVTMVSLLSYVVVEQRQGLWFVFLTEGYLAFLDTFMPYQADGGIVRSLIVGFLLLAVIHFAAMQKMSTVKVKGRFAYLRSLVAPMMVICLSVGVAYAAPKKAASWPDPIAYLTGEDGLGNGTGTLKKVGYDDHDERLGGPFRQDNSLVFLATTKEKYYWRGDSKDFYTGKGWQKAHEDYAGILTPTKYKWEDTLFEPDQNTREVTVSLSFRGGEQFATMFYPGQLQSITGMSPQLATLQYDDVSQNIEARNGKIMLETSADSAGMENGDFQTVGAVPADATGEINGSVPTDGAGQQVNAAVPANGTDPANRTVLANGAPVNGSNEMNGVGSTISPNVTERISPSRLRMMYYQMKVEVPVLSEKKLLQSGKDYPEEVKGMYLQLPETLPQRVRDLAATITKNAKTPYEKVRAIENHLRTTGAYRYETEDVPAPTAEQDFVDHFLFESQRGYCDHFSTSMTVMLRSVGIPARWVKGFAEGTEVERNDNGEMTIEVRNKDAHSWVEVYFEDYGWIPFEATTTFASPVRVNYDTNTEEAAQQAVPASAQNNSNETNKDRLDRLADDEDTTTGGKTFSWNWLWWVGAALAVGLVMAWKRRQRLVVWWMQRKMATYQPEQFMEKYTTLLVLCERVIAPRKSGETLREYVKRLQVSGDQRQDLMYLTHLYEKVSYGFKDIEDKARGIANQIMDRFSKQMRP